jgi:hypothetical protein
VSDWFKSALVIFILAAIPAAFLLLPGFFATTPAPVQANPPVIIPGAKPSAPLPKTNPAPAAKPPAATENDPAKKIGRAPKAENLIALGMNNDAQSLATILAALTNADAEIRAVARDAAIQFGDHAAIAPLRAAAEWTTNLEEKMALLDAAKFLELPPLPVAGATNQPAIP